MLAAAAACRLSPDLAQPIAIEVTTRDSLEEYDMLLPIARVLTGGGAVDTTIKVYWFSPDTTIRVDSTSGRTVVRVSGMTGRLLARADGLLSNPVTIRTLAAADTAWAAGPKRDSVPASGGLSDSLQVAVADTVASTTGGGVLTVPLPGRPVVYTITYPKGAGPFTLVTTDTARALDTTATVATAASGIAFVKVRRLATSPPPDSVVVAATARRAVGDTVRGCPITFIVRFLP